MRLRDLPLLPLLALLPATLAGCGAESVAGPVLAVGAASVAVAGKTPVDMAATWFTGRECSIVRLDRRESYCAPPPPPPGAVPFCTRSLGSVDCWLVAPPSGERVGAATIPSRQVAGPAGVVVVPAAAAPAAPPDLPQPTGALAQ
ncbi:MAG TPA: hypothetical protein VE033_13030 [Acetobacteraceae bacterium]|jgi:hypothetical protein|nr:hypothetical protein [Acetobacteraceae bacterium]